MIKFDRVNKKFNNGKLALKDICFCIEEKDFVFLTGPSGAGKTTVFNILMALDKPNSGSVKFNDWNLTKLPLSKIPLLRQKIGMVFQELKLLSDRSVWENVALALEVMEDKNINIKNKVKEALYIVGMEDDGEKFPVQLSGGELQRVAIARAIVKKPDILLADEPTADLDPGNAWEIIKLLESINKLGTTIIMATHNIDIVNSLGKRVISLLNGEVVKDEKIGKY